jgi:hypothetical protein
MKAGRWWYGNFNVDICIFRSRRGIMQSDPLTFDCESCRATRRKKSTPPWNMRSRWDGPLSNQRKAIAGESFVARMAGAVARNQFGRLRECRRIMLTRSGGSSIGVLTDETMQTHHFILILAGISELTEDLANACYDAVRGDIELNLRDGVAYLEVRRGGRTFRQAIVSTIRQIEKAVPGVRVVRVESEAANTIAKINADLLGVLSAS